MLKFKKIFIGNNCLNSCVFCNVKNKSNNTQLSNITKQMAQRGNLDSLELYGGEPTLRNDFFSILDAARNHGFKRIKIITNARPLHDINMAVKTIESGCYFFEIKLHHYRPDIHDSITQANGSLQQTIEGLINLRRINTIDQKPFSAFISLKISITKENYEDIGNIALAFMPYKIDRFILSFDDYKLEMFKALPFVHNAINLSILNRIWIVTKKIPLCAMKGLEHHVSENFHIPDSDYKKFQKCKECIYGELCPGMCSLYLENIGFDEFQPISESRHINDIRVLHNEQD